MVKDKDPGGAKANRAHPSRLFGVARQRAQALNPHSGGDKTYDYEEKYPPDANGMEMSSDARVWLVYLDESEEYDREMIEGWRDTIDVLLVFAGLFSAVVTTFVVQTSQSLQPNYAEITASLMTELVSLQRSIATGVATNVVHSSLDINSRTTSSSDIWVNALWIASLSFALGAALISVLVKQWLQHYTAALIGTPRERVVLRHFRFLGLERWKVPLIIGFLPVLLHIALLLFFGGLAVFLAPANTTVAAVVIFIGGLLFIIYVGTNILPLLFVDCPYKNHLSDYIYFLGQSISFTCRKVYRWMRQTPPHDKDESGIISIKEREMTYALDQTDMVATKALLWLDKTASNLTVGSVVLQALGALPAKFDQIAMALLISDPNAFQQRLLNSLDLYMRRLEIHPDAETLSMSSRLARSLRRLGFGLGSGHTIKLGGQFMIWWDKTREPLQLYHDLSLVGPSQYSQNPHHVLGSLATVLKIDLPLPLWHDLIGSLLDPANVATAIHDSSVIDQQWTQVVNTLLHAVWEQLLPVTQAESFDGLTWDESSKSLKVACKEDKTLNLLTMQLLSALCHIGSPSPLPTFNDSNLLDSHKELIEIIGLILPLLSTTHNSLGHNVATSVYYVMHEYLSILVADNMERDVKLMGDPVIMQIALTSLAELVDRSSSWIPERGHLNPTSHSRLVIRVVSAFTQHLKQPLHDQNHQYSLEHLLKYVLRFMKNYKMAPVTRGHVDWMAFQICEHLSLILLMDPTAYHTLHETKGVPIIREYFPLSWQVSHVMRKPYYIKALSMLRNGLLSYIQQLQSSGENTVQSLDKEDVLWLCRLFILADDSDIPETLDPHQMPHKFLASLQLDDSHCSWRTVLQELTKEICNISFKSPQYFAAYRRLEEMKMVLGFNSDGYQLYHHITEHELESGAESFGVHRRVTDNGEVQYVSGGLGEPRLCQKLSSGLWEVPYNHKESPSHSHSVVHHATEPGHPSRTADIPSPPTIVLKKHDFMTWWKNRRAKGGLDIEMQGQPSS